METAHLDDDIRSPIQERITDLDGSSLLVTGRPMVGKEAFVDRTIRSVLSSNRELIHVSASRGYDQVADRIPSSSAIVDCSPTPAPELPGVFDVGTPSDLTGISMPVSDLLAHTGSRPVVTLDSVTTILMYCKDSSVFRFLSVLTGQIRQVNGVGLFILEEGCHDEQTVRTFQQLFDGRIDVERDRVRTRGIDGISPNWKSR